MKHPVQDLVELAARIRHERAERARQPDQSRWHRRQGARLEELTARFDDLVERWTPPEQHDAWRAFREGTGDAPEAPPRRQAPLWLGVGPGGATLEILPGPTGDGAEVWLEGELVRRDLAWDRGTVRIGDLDYVETHRAPEEALDALRAWLGRHGEPPWAWARALLEDGLVDRDFALTERGRRVVRANGGPAAQERPTWTRWVA